MKIRNAVHRLWFIILASHVAKAVRYDKKKCSVARSLKSRKDITDVIIGASVSTVTFTSGVTLRYRTPSILRDALNHWDRKGEWGLPAGEYYLDLPKKTKKTKTTSKKKPVKFYTSGRRRLHARNPRHIAFLRQQRAA